MNRWLVLASLVYAIGIAWTGFRSDRSFSKSDDTVRHLTATISHIQLMLGFYLYMISPVVKLNGAETTTADFMSEPFFFRLIHIALMVISVVIVTIGSAKAKRVETDQLKFKTMLIWFIIALLIIIVAIPWPFSPLASRPYFRSF